MLSHCLWGFCYFLTVCVIMTVDLVIKVVRGLHSQLIAQTGYGGSESDKVCVNIMFNKSRDFISRRMD